MSKWKITVIPVDGDEGKAEDMMLEIADRYRGSAVVSMKSAADRDKQQTLIDIMFNMVYNVTQESTKWKPNRVEAMHWVADQLWKCGFKTIPMGSAWGSLIENNNFTEADFKRTWSRMLEQEKDFAE